MKLLALDISTNTGWAFFEDGNLKHTGIINCKDSDIDYKNFSIDSTAAMIFAAYTLSFTIQKLIILYNIDEVVIEQTNKGRSRYTQKLLEWLHFQVIIMILQQLQKYPIYLDSSQWRSLVGLKMSKEDKKHNANLKKDGGRGKINKKHLAVRLVNDLYQLNYKMKDNDKADAVLLGLAYLKGTAND